MRIKNGQVERTRNGEKKCFHFNRMHYERNKAMCFFSEDCETTASKQNGFIFLCGKRRKKGSKWNSVRSFSIK